MNTINYVQHARQPPQYQSQYYQPQYHQQGMQPELCLNYQKGFCQNGSSCPRVHLPHFTSRTSQFPPSRAPVIRRQQYSDSDTSGDELSLAPQFPQPRFSAPKINTNIRPQIPSWPKKRIPGSICPSGYCWEFCRTRTCPRPRCTFSHLPHEDKPPAPKAERHPHPKTNEICWLWDREWCPWGYDCQYVHGDLEYDSPIPSPVDMDTPKPRTEMCAQEGDASKVEEPPPSRQRPRTNEVCLNARRGWCQRGYACRRIHEDLEYDEPVILKSIPRSLPPPPPPPPPPTTEWEILIHNYIHVKVDRGFVIREVQTGFETPWLYIEGLPAAVKEEAVKSLVTPFGHAEVKALAGTVARIRFKEHVDARNAAASLDETKHFGVVLRARLSMTPDAVHGRVRDTTIRIEWDAPSVTAYGGFSTLERARTAIAATHLPFLERSVHAKIYEGMPQVGMHTVKYWNLPADLKQTKASLEELGAPDDVMWDPVPYRSAKDAISAVRRNIENHLKTGMQMKEWAPVPGPYMDGRIRVFATFESAGTAAYVAAQADTRKPVALGWCRLSVRHLKKMVLTTSAWVYASVRQEVQQLCKMFTSKEDALVVKEEDGQEDVVEIHLISEDLKQLGRLRKNLRRVLRGETVKLDDKIAWDAFFEEPAGYVWVSELRDRYPLLRISCVSKEKRIVLRGPSGMRARANEEILTQIKQLRARTPTTVHIPTDLLGYFLAKQLPILKTELGLENIHMDIRTKTFEVYGLAAATMSRNAVQAARAAQRPASTRSGCPVCLDDVEAPFLLRCGHAHCRGCLRAQGACTELMPLHCARDILTLAEFNGLVKAAFELYVSTRPDEFIRCPTAECAQVFRSNKALGNTVLRCPDCLVGICAQCGGESHEGEACALDDDEDEMQFRQWKEQNGVKPCPGCKVDIERSEGCNHVTCVRCNTHICWECLATFPRGEGIYDHMRSAHGSIGLIPFF
ncbi:hypothetical protein CYLTODRAFT_493855 [Cylindrobasidium torrendii FP15055 ss-10]|uniref:RBR-type E3 ubiquitin transferase n=1 Tax=Cylindrobasidium torrendii FP15055 ss-10 TaxID=1314674 RepID=A0A0D7AYS4_9AGAR|nr:hypothetical protein CYLTODRAFT_493855 [Cylindrobasidium torrendii FP15055 ss-10]